MVVGFTTTCAISAYHHQSCEFESCSWRVALDPTLCDKVCQWLATSQCTYLISWSNGSSTVTFTILTEVSTNADQYVSLGLSPTQSMVILLTFI
jgi:hypothetical protein